MKLLYGLEIESNWSRQKIKDWLRLKSSSSLTKQKAWSTNMHFDFLLLDREWFFFGGWGVEECIWKCFELRKVRLRRLDCKNLYRFYILSRWNIPPWQTTSQNSFSFTIRLNNVGSDFIEITFKWQFGQIEYSRFLNGFFSKLNVAGFFQSRTR